MSGTQSISTQPAPEPRAQPLSAELDSLTEAFAERSVTLREVLAVLHGRAHTFFLLILALPFCTPIPLPGVSTPFGLIIALIGFRLSLGQKPWFPNRLLNTRLPPRFFKIFFSGARRVVRGMERLLKPRWTFLLDLNVLHHLYGLVIFSCGLFLLLPLPIPFSNGLPALTVVLIAAATLERDGYFVIAGLSMFLFTLSFFAMLLWGGAEATAWLKTLLDRFLAGG